jgi:hypothetical protein
LRPNDDEGGMEIWRFEKVVALLRNGKWRALVSTAINFLAP